MVKKPKEKLDPENEVVEVWKDLPNAKVKTKMTKAMEKKLDNLLLSIKDNWKSQLEEAIIQMISFNFSHSDSLIWYGHLITACEIKKDLSLSAAAGVLFKFDKYILFINPLLFNLYPLDEQIAILKHEMLHIINLHIMRQNNREHKRWNYATDIAINQLISNIPEEALQPETYDLKRNLNAEQYYDLLSKTFDNEQNSESSNNSKLNGNNQQNGKKEELINDDIIDNEQKLRDMIANVLNTIQGQIGDHDKWSLSEGDEMAAKEVIRQMSETATNKCRGLFPLECSVALQILKQKEQIDWKKELRRIIGNRRAFSKLSIKKKHRRFPNRNDLRGKIKSYTKDIIVLLDVSGSMSNDEILYGLNEIKAIAEKTKTTVTIIQIDSEPKIIEKFNPKKTIFERKGDGGTYITPGIELIKEKNLACDAIICITDGYIEYSFDISLPKVPFIFLVTDDENNLSLDITQYKRMKKHTLKIEKK